MSFRDYLVKQMDEHPSAFPQDIVKLCFQAAFGAEHLLSDLTRARAYLKKEFADTQAGDVPLYEIISEDVCRVNLAAWKFHGLPEDWLFEMFPASASVPQGSRQLFLQYLETAGAVIQERQADSEWTGFGQAASEQAVSRLVVSGPAHFTYEDWKEYLAEYERLGMPAVHHSQAYREWEKPAYRIVSSSYVRLFPILEQAVRSAQAGSQVQTGSQSQAGKPCVIAIDGRAASGKSTMARQLQSILGAQIVEMDDFFLPLELRTRERFETPGGNVHYERFMEEVLPYLAEPESFSYRRFDCGKMDYDGARVVESAQFRIVEGCYSCHPLFGDYADITVFSDIEPGEQMQRILHRNGPEMAEMFRSRWIPLEEEYFREYEIGGRAHVQI